MYQFFVEPSQIQGDRAVVMGKDVNHIKNVLRMKPGDKIILKNGCDNRRYTCQVAAMDESRIDCNVCSVEEGSGELPSKIYLFQGLPKSDKMELIIQKAVELGVYEIIPVMCCRSVVKLD